MAEKCCTYLKTTDIKMLIFCCKIDRHQIGYINLEYNTSWGNAEFTMSRIRKIKKISTLELLIKIGTIVLTVLTVTVRPKK